MSDATCQIDGCEKTRTGRQKICAMHRSRIWRYGDPNHVIQVRMDSDVCRIDGCEKLRMTKPRRTTCAMHYARIRRHGAADANFRRVAADQRIGSNGYILVSVDPNHPLVPNPDNHPYVYQHRLVLFDAIGDGPHSCHYCGTTIWWMPTDGQTRLTVDHVDRNRENNDPSNLVPACGPCNAARAMRSRCQRGHALTPENIIPGTKRRCVACDLERQQRQS